MMNRQLATSRASVESSFGLGELVELKSGGPAMTVRSADGDTVECEWFDGAKPRLRSYFAKQLVSIERKISDLELARRIAYVFSKSIEETGVDPKDMSLGEQISHLSRVK